MIAFGIVLGVALYIGSYLALEPYLLPPLKIVKPKEPECPNCGADYILYTDATSSPAVECALPTCNCTYGKQNAAAIERMIAVWDADSVKFDRTRASLVREILNLAEIPELDGSRAYDGGVTRANLNQAA